HAELLARSRTDAALLVSAEMAPRLWRPRPRRRVLEPVDAVGRSAFPPGAAPAHAHAHRHWSGCALCTGESPRSPRRSIPHGGPVKGARPGARDGAAPSSKRAHACAHDAGALAAGAVFG